MSLIALGVATESSYGDPRFPGRLVEVTLVTKSKTKRDAARIYVIAHYDKAERENSVGMSPFQARKVAAMLIAAAEQAEL